MYRFLRVVTGALMVVCVAAPGSATVVRGARTAQALLPLPAATAAPYRGAHGVRTNDARGSVLVVAPAGCSTTGMSSFVGGGSSNYAGGQAAGVLAGSSNEACDAGSIVGAGDGNIVGGDGGSNMAAVVAGIDGRIEMSTGAVIGGGLNNSISDLPPYGNSNLSAIAAGDANVIESPDSFIGSGQANTIVPPSVKLPGPYSPSAFIGAGYGNTISSDFAVITGGYDNAMTGEYGTIAGGFNNKVTGIQGVVSGGYGNVASGRNAVVPGGAYNAASGEDSFAAGNAAKATYDGTFVWSDYSATAGVTSTAANQFIARAAGGFYLYSSSTLKSGVKLAAGSGSWSSLSDRAAKTGVTSVDDAQILAKVATLPVSEWSYTAQGTGIRHVGPMAQDFRAAFGLGEDEKHISAVDEDGVALAAIKALQAEVVAKDRSLAKLDTKYTLLERRLEAIERAMGASH